MHETSSQNKASAQPARRGGFKFGRRLLICAVLIAALAVGLFGRGTAARWARQRAAGQVSLAALGAAQRWLAWANWLDPADGQTDLMRATCFRHLGHRDDWQSALEAAGQKRVSNEAIEIERTLGHIRWGEVDSISASDFQDLLDAGVPPQDAATMLVFGCVAQGNLETARAVIEAYASDAPQDAQILYLRGVYAWSSGQLAAALLHFEQTLLIQARHEPARTGLARLLEDEYQLEAALGHYVELAVEAPEREEVRLGLARVLRKQGRVDQAREVLSPRGSLSDPSANVALELGEIEYEAGNYGAARSWFERADLDRPLLADTLRAAASNFAMNEDAADAERLFALVDQTQSQTRRLSELQFRLAIDPSDQIASDELQRLGAPPQPAAANSQPPLVSPLYLRHCAACHGEDGGGGGRAARHLYPRPRDLRSGRFRLASTLNGVPTLDDLEEVIQRGMPGTSMPPFQSLRADERNQLAREVQRLHREGARDQLRAALEQEDEPIDEDQLRRLVATRTRPADVLPVPAIEPASGEAINRGKQLYFRSGCDKCHGADGTGAWDLRLVDDQGQPALPRDLVRDPMKGGQDPKSLYQRIRLGMPGTPHPASAGLSEAELVDLVQFCRSLAVEPKRALTNYQRTMRAFARPAGAAAGEPPRLEGQAVQEG